MLLFPGQLPEAWLQFALTVIIRLVHLVLRRPESSRGPMVSGTVEVPLALPLLLHEPNEGSFQCPEFPCRTGVLDGVPSPEFPDTMGLLKGVRVSLVAVLLSGED